MISFCPSLSQLLLDVGENKNKQNVSNSHRDRERGLFLIATLLINIAGNEIVGSGDKTAEINLLLGRMEGK